jgi:hypothetical protein
LVKSSWGLAHPMSLKELALLDGRRPLPLVDVIGLTLTLSLSNIAHYCIFTFSYIVKSVVIKKENKVEIFTEIQALGSSVYVHYFHFLFINWI